MFFFQAEDGIRDLVRSRGLGDVYKRQVQVFTPEGAAVSQFGGAGLVDGALDAVAGSDDHVTVSRIENIVPTLFGVYSSQADQRPDDDEGQGQP